MRNFPVVNVSNYRIYLIFMLGLNLRAYENPYADHLAFYQSLESVCMEVASRTKRGADLSMFEEMGVNKNADFERSDVYLAMGSSFRLSQQSNALKSIRYDIAFDGTTCQSLQFGTSSAYDGVLQIWKWRGDYMKRNNLTELPTMKMNVDSFVWPLAPLGFVSISTDRGRHSLYETLYWHELSKEYVKKKLEKLSFVLIKEEEGRKIYLSSDPSLIQSDGKKINYGVEIVAYKEFGGKFLVKAWEKRAKDLVLERYEYDYLAVAAPDKIGSSVLKTYPVPALTSGLRVYNGGTKLFDGDTQSEYKRLELNTKLSPSEFTIDPTNARIIRDEDANMIIER
jgi:hypothetical protein